MCRFAAPWSGQDRPWPGGDARPPWLRPLSCDASRSVTASSTVVNLRRPADVDDALADLLLEAWENTG